MPKEAATQGNTCFYFREEKDDNKVILEDKDLEVIGTPSVQYDDCTVIAQVRKWQLALRCTAAEWESERHSLCCLVYSVSKEY